MLLTTVAAFLLPAVSLAVPTQKLATTEDAATPDTCVPLFYILTEYMLTISPNYYYVSFNLQSTYTADSLKYDRVEAGANCEADGVEISSKGNQCNVKGQRTDKLVLYREGGSDEANYRIDHTWDCDGATWSTSNHILFPPLDCQTTNDDKDGRVTKCTIRPLMFQPQNARKMDVDKKKMHGGTEAHNGKKTNENKKAHKDEKASNDKAKATETATQPAHNML